jgi:hypothetical protein
LNSNVETEAEETAEGVFDKEKSVIAKLVLFPTPPREPKSAQF